MSNYKYKSWGTYLYEQFFGDSDPTYELSIKFQDAVCRPDLREFIAHQKRQVANAADAGDTDSRWSRLEWSIAYAENAMEKYDARELAMAFTDLGRAIEAFSYPSKEQLGLLLKSRMARLKSVIPLQKKRAEANTLRETAQKLAADAWKDDLDQTIRLGEMCERVYRALAPIAHKAGSMDGLPSEAAGLKPWLRPVAPEWARRGGRPRKAK